MQNLPLSPPPPGPGQSRPHLPGRPSSVASAPLLSGLHTAVSSLPNLAHTRHLPPSGQKPKSSRGHRPCTTCPRPLPVSPRSLCSSHTGLLAVPPTRQALSCLRAFALAEPAAWKVLGPGVSCLSLGPCSKVRFVASPGFKAGLSQSLLPVT